MINWLADFVANGDFKIKPEALTSIVNHAHLSMELAKMELNKEGELDVNYNTQRNLIRPEILKGICNKLKAQGLTIDDETINKIEQYEDFYTDYIAEYKSNVVVERNKIFDELKNRNKCTGNF